ncbi:MAG: ornithine carbamoyltransferase [archaeon]
MAKPRHVIELKDFSKKEIEDIIDLGIRLKKNSEKYSKSMENKTLAMLFQKTSTRTRLSFEAGMTRLGGHAIFVDSSTTQFDKAEIGDEARCISRYADLIMMRPLKNSVLVKIAEASSVPVINGCCEKYHPCQALADMMTIKEHFGKFSGLNIVWLGIANNVSNSLMLAATKLGAKFNLCVAEWDQDAIDPELNKMVKGTGLFTESKDPKKAAKDADVLVTDTWVNMEKFNDPAFAAEKERRIKTFMPYQLNKKLIEGLNVKILHCLPAHYGYEVDDYVINSKQSMAFDEAENRMHAQNALMLKLVGRA